MKSRKTETGEGGRIVFVSSQMAQAALYGYTAYATSKWALRGFAEALHKEMLPYGILVSVAYPPGTVPSPIYGHAPPPWTPFL